MSLFGPYKTLQELDEEAQQSGIHFTEDLTKEEKESVTASQLKIIAEGNALKAQRDLLYFEAERLERQLDINSISTKIASQIYLEIEIWNDNIHDPYKEIDNYNFNFGILRTEEDDCVFWYRITRNVTRPSNNNSSSRPAFAFTVTFGGPSHIESEEYATCIKKINAQVAPEQPTNKRQFEEEFPNDNFENNRNVNPQGGEIMKFGVEFENDFERNYGHDRPLWFEYVRRGMKRAFDIFLLPNETTIFKIAALDNPSLDGSSNMYGSVYDTEENKMRVIKRLKNLASKM